LKAQFVHKAGCGLDVPTHDTWKDLALTLTPFDKDVTEETSMARSVHKVGCGPDAPLHGTWMDLALTLSLVDKDVDIEGAKCAQGSLCS